MTDLRVCELNSSIDFQNIACTGFCLPQRVIIEVKFLAGRQTIWFLNDFFGLESTDMDDGFRVGSIQYTRIKDSFCYRFLMLMDC